MRGLLAQRYGSRVLDITESKAETLCAICFEISSLPWILLLASYSALSMARFGERLTACRLIICGGDGSVHSVFEQVELLPLASKPLLGVIPLGTGNGPTSPAATAHMA